MASGENFFKKDPPHGLVKRLILKKYLQAYIPIMLPENKPENKLRIVDGFAGTGVYKDYGWAQEIEKYGSPIIALRVAIEHLLGLKEFQPSEHDKEIDQTYDSKLKELCRTTMETLHVTTENQTLSLIYVEADENTYKELFKNIIQILRIYGLKIRISYNLRHGICKIRFDRKDTERPPLNYRIAVTLFCAEFKQLRAPSAPSFAFIDPFGYTHTPFDKVKSYVGKGKEVFINLMSSFINRFISAKPEQIGELFGMSLQEVSEWRTSKAETEDRILQLVDKYQKRMQDANGRFTVNFEIRGLNNARLYHLVFSTNHIKGLEVMKEAMNRGTQETNKFSASDYQIIKEGKPISFLNDQMDDDVAEVIHREFKGRTVTITTVKNFILFDTLYVFRKKPLAVLEKVKKMEVVGPDEPRRANQYPDRTDWLLKFSDSHAL